MTLYRRGGNVFGIVLVTAALAIGGCGGGGGGGSSTGPSACDPCVTNFQITPQTPEKANTQVQYLISATVTDPENDLIGGRAEVTTGNTVSKTLVPSDFQGSTLRVVLVTNPVPPGRYSGTFTVIDAAGHRSNDSSFVVNIALGTSAGSARENVFERLVPVR